MTGEEDWDWKRIGEQVRLRRGELGYKRQDDLVAAAPDVKITFLREVEQGKPGRRRSANLSALATALRWRRDAFERIGRGESLDADELAVRMATVEQKVDGLATGMEEVRQSLAELHRSFAGLRNAIEEAR